MNGVGGVTGAAARIAALCRRELQTIFTSPLAYVFIVIFLGLTGGLTFLAHQLERRFKALGFNNKNACTLNPLVFGVGIPLFRRRLLADRLDLVAHRAFDSGHLILEYRVDSPISAGG